MTRPYSIFAAFAAFAIFAAFALPGCEVLESCELADERELHDPGRTVALLGDDQLGDALRIGGRLALVGVHVLAVDEDDDVGVLLEGAGLSEVGELWPV